MEDLVHTGTNVTQERDRTITVIQNHYTDNLEDLPKGTNKDRTSEQKRFPIKEIAGKLHHLNLSRLNLVFNVRISC